MTSLPTELVSKIMVFHSNIRFDKNELFKFVRVWERVKKLQEDNWNFIDIDYDEFDRLVYSSPLIIKFYHRYVGYDPKPDLSRSHENENYFIPPILPVD